MRDFAVGRIDAAGSDPNEELIPAWLWTHHIRHAEAHTVAHKDRGFHGMDTHHHVFLVFDVREHARARRQCEKQSYCTKSMQYCLEEHQARAFSRASTLQLELRAISIRMSTNAEGCA